MTKADLRKIVVGAIRDLVTSLGRKCPEVTDDMRPIPDLGLESADGIWIACELAAKGIPVPLRDNPFVADEDGGRRPRSVREMIETCGGYPAAEEGKPK